MAFTPGPWQYDRRSWRNEQQERDWYVRGDIREVEDEDDDGGQYGTVATSVCIVPGNATSHPVCEDTARLISAAPELLAACQLAMEHLVNEPSLDACRAAIAKATKGSQ